MKIFEIGKTYTMRSPGNQDCAWTYTVTKRTPKTITITDGKEIKTCRVNAQTSEARNAESIYPLGHYSMCPILSADSEEVQELPKATAEEVPNWQAQFLQNQADSYCIYHLKNNVDIKAETAYENYDTFYAGELGELSAIGNVEKVLDELYMKLNGTAAGLFVHSLWAGDVVALKCEGVTSYYRVTGTGYAQVQNFIPEPVTQI